MKRNGQCEVGRCGRDGDLTYYGHLICDGHWNLFCGGHIDLKAIFHIVDEPQTGVVKEKFDVAVEDSDINLQDDIIEKLLKG